jgi:ribosomal protein S13
MISNKNEYIIFYNSNKNFPIYSCFQKIYGFGKSTKNTKLFFKSLGLNFLKKKNLLLKFLNIDQQNITVFIISIFLIKKLKSTLNKIINLHISYKHVIGSYKYIQKTHRLPINGQRTHTNAKTNKKLNK